MSTAAATNFASRFGGTAGIKSKQLWADMSDSDEDESGDSAPLFVSPPPPTITQAAPRSSGIATPQPTTPPAQQQAKPQQAAKVASPVLAAKPNPWAKPLALAATTTTHSVTATPSSPPTSAQKAPTQAASPTSAPAFPSPVVTAASVAKKVASAHMPPPKKVAAPQFKTWGDLTASLSGKVAVSEAPASVSVIVSKPLMPAGLSDAEDDELVAAAAAIPEAGGAFDPELDSSRDGLPLLFKGLHKAPAQQELSVVMEEENSKSRQGTKRKEMDSASEPQIPAGGLDMTALVAGFKAEAAPAVVAKPAWNGAGLMVVKPAAPIAPTEAQHPATGKKIKSEDGSAKAVELPQQAPVLTRPASFLSAVTGVSSAAMEDAVAPVAAAAAVENVPMVVKVDMEQRLKQRQKQIAMGKNTPEYQNYLVMVPIATRTAAHPRTPDVRKACSKRSMDGQVRQWRRLLHEYDPAVVAAKANGTYVAPAQTSGHSSEADMEDQAE